MTTFVRKEPVSWSCEFVHELCGRILSDEPDAQFDALRSLNQGLSMKKVKKQVSDYIIAENLLPHLLQRVELQVNDKIHAVYAEALCAIGNVIASLSAEQIGLLFDLGIVTTLVHFLATTNRTKDTATAIDEANGVLCKLCEKSNLYRTTVINEGGFRVALISADSISLDNIQPSSNKVVLCLWSMIGKKPSAEKALVGLALPVLSRLLSMSDDMLLINTCRTLSAIAEDCPRVEVPKIIDESLAIPSKLMGLLNVPAMDVQSAALKAIGSIISCDGDGHTALFLDLQLLLKLCDYLDNPQMTIRREALWVVSNIAAEGSVTIQAVLNTPLVTKIFVLLDASEIDFKELQEMAWILSNIVAQGSVEQVLSVVHAGVLPVFCKFLSMKQTHMVTIALEGISKILEISKETNQLESIIKRLDDICAEEQLENLMKSRYDSHVDLAGYILQFFVNEEDEVDGKEEGESS